MSSPGLADGGTLDSSHAASANNCGGGNVSPALQWRNTPAGTKSYAVTIFDPDGAKGLGIVHWVLYGVAPSTTGLGAGASRRPAAWPERTGRAALAITDPARRLATCRITMLRRSMRSIYRPMHCRPD